MKGDKGEEGGWRWGGGEVQSLICEEWREWEEGEERREAWREWEESEWE